MFVQDEIRIDEKAVGGVEKLIEEGWGVAEVVEFSCKKVVWGFFKAFFNCFKIWFYFGEFFKVVDKECII